jgi:hypothetical protein
VRSLSGIAGRLLGLGRLYSFVLRLDGVDLADAQHIDALYEGGCADAIFGCTDGEPYATFSRRATSAPKAVSGAMTAIETAIPGARVIGIERDDGPLPRDSTPVRRVATVADRPLAHFVNARMDAFVVVMNAAVRSRASVSDLQGEDELRLVRGIVNEDIRMLR